MIETMRERLERIEKECKCITAFVASLKCKTEDGMICTLAELTVEKADCPKGISLAEYADSEFIKAVLDTMNQLTAANCLYSPVENIAIKCSTVTKVWVEHEFNQVDP